MIPAEAKAAMQGAIPSILATCSPDGIPNVTHISQVWYVDETHVAASYQFFNKTKRNIAANPKAQMRLFDPKDSGRWVVEVRYIRTETSGRTFDDMESQLEAIASMTGMEDVFHLQGADIYEVISIRRTTFIPE